MQPKATVVRVEEVLPHPRADHLELIRIKGQQTVVGKGEFKSGDLAAWIPAGLVVPDWPEFGFLTYSPNVMEILTQKGHFFPTPERFRYIRPRKFRGEWSVGLLMPLKYDSFVRAFYYESILNYVTLGQDITKLFQITRPTDKALHQRLLNLYEYAYRQGFKAGHEDARQIIEVEFTRIKIG